MNNPNEINKEKGYGESYNPAGNEEESSFDIRILWMLFLRYKYWIAASVIVCLISALIYLRYTIPVYNITSKVLIKDQDKRSYSGINSTFQELGFMNSSDGFDNEIEVLSTKTLNKKVVRELKLYTTYFYDGNIKDNEIYGKYSPFLLDYEDGAIDSLHHTIEVTLSKKEENYMVNIKYQDAELKKIITGFPANISTTFGKITIERNPLFDISLANSRNIANDDNNNEEKLDRDLIVRINPIDPVAIAYSSKMSVEATSKTTTVAQLSINDNIPERGADYLNKLIEIYNDEASIDNNQEATRTADFIDTRLGIISKELNMTEAELEQYKKISGITDYASDAKTDVGQKLQYETQIVEVSTQLNLVDYLLEYVNDSHNYLQIIPANIGLKDSSLPQVISKYNETVMERNRLLRVSSENSPTVTTLTNEAEGYLVGIKASLNSAKRQLSIQHKDLVSQQNKYNSQISSAPTKERALADINRQKEVKAGLYLMLLQKREENAITLASTAYKGKMIEEPIINNIPISPKKKIILLIALVIGIALPFAYHYIRNFFNYRIKNADDLGKLTNVPLLGTVPYVKALAKGNRTVVVQENRNSIMVEVYRILRSNLPFVLNPNQNVILFTSTVAGEGKTSVASNLATSIAFVGKKVLIIGLDIRKPRLAKLFKLGNNEVGITNFLTRRVDDYEYLESLIQNSGISPNLDILPAGPIPPNPAELLEKENLASAISFLKKKYDYVILDTAPVGLVSDTLTIGRHADLTLYLVRADYTLKADMNLVNSLSVEKRLPNINIILNGAVTETNNYSYKRYGGYSYGKGYGYSYNYGYGYGKESGKKLEEV
ncbi:MAG: polysaccharide biosynthesis tyrosine autokinase [Bacteroides sp.]|nr:polysaccharide biosynthesis tyrosine autokinase [Roseburia sp.]MCM1345505.1 polysaccharide biosynthesis tyrosine autokinase [Bacteroides sp.]MCM1420014.1 polysaccharide biosynthesis tyrosine autokinase [Bacteroides sp.]